MRSNSFPFYFIIDGLSALSRGRIEISLQFGKEAISPLEKKKNTSLHLVWSTIIVAFPLRCGAVSCSMDRQEHMLLPPVLRADRARGTLCVLLPMNLPTPITLVSRSPWIVVTILHMHTCDYRKIGQ